MQQPTPTKRSHCNGACAIVEYKVTVSDKDVDRIRIWDVKIRDYRNGACAFLEYKVTNSDNDVDRVRILDVKMQFKNTPVGQFSKGFLLLSLFVLCFLPT